MGYGPARHDELKEVQRSSLVLNECGARLLLWNVRCGFNEQLLETLPNLTRNITIKIRIKDLRNTFRRLLEKCTQKSQNAAGATSILRHLPGNEGALKPPPPMDTRALIQGIR